MLKETQEDKISSPSVVMKTQASWNPKSHNKTHYDAAVILSSLLERYIPCRKPKAQLWIDE